MDIQALDEEYLHAGNWKCSKSPSHAHYWREIKASHHTGIFFCIHCFDCREFPIGYQATTNAGFTDTHVTWTF